MLDTVTVVTSWPGDQVRVQLHRVLELDSQGLLVWDVSKGEYVEGSWSSKVRLRDAAVSTRCNCGAVRHDRQWLCEDHQRLIRRGGNPEYVKRPGGNSDFGPWYWEPRPGAVSKCDESVWVPRWLGHYERGLSVSGSLAKYVQGHNVTSPWEAVEIHKLLGEFLHAWQIRFCEDAMELNGPCKMLIPPSMATSELIDVSRLDIALTFRVGETRRDAEDFLRGIRYSVRARKSQTSDDSSASVSGSGEHMTVYIGKHSTERTWKFYLKDVEIEKKGRHRLFDEDERMREIAVEFLRGTVRLELTLRRSWLPATGVPVSAGDLQVMMEHWDRLEKGENMRINGALLEEARRLKPAARDAYQLWERGENVRLYFPKPTFYRHRKVVKEATGVDIGIQRPLEGVVEPKDLDYSREFLEGAHVPHEAFPVELGGVDREPVLPFGSGVG